LNVQNFTTELVSMLFTLAVVLVLAWIVLRVLKRSQLGKSSDDKLKFVRALPVGSRERVVLVEYRGKEYMLGVTPGGINLLEKRAVTTELIPREDLTELDNKP